MKNTVILLLLSLLTCYGLEAGTLLKFHVAEESEIPRGEEIERENKDYDLQVYLGETIIDEESPEGICVWNFDTKRKYQSVEEQSAFVNYSLFSDLGFRVYEFQNRLKLGGALEAVGIEDNPMDRILMEHLFSLTSDEESKLDRKSKKSRIIFKHSKKVLLEYSNNSEPAESEVIGRFVLYLRYRFGIHPQILTELESLNGIPNELIIYRYDVGQERIELRFISIDDNYAEPSRELSVTTPLEDGLLYQTSAKATDYTKKAYADACVSLKKRAVTSARKSDYLDSIGLFLAYTLATGEQMPEEFFEFRDAITQNADVQLLFSSLKPLSEETAPQALKDLEKLSEKAKEGQCAILIFKANTLAHSGKPYEAIDAFLAALSLEPAIVGAWKDLGDVYYSIYDAIQAWHCWDTGRSLLINHSLFNAVNEFEDTLQTDHPEFFLR